VGRGTVTVVCGPGALARRERLLARGVEVVVAPLRSGRVDLRAALRLLRGLGVLSLMVEGGSELLGSFLDRRLLDEVALFRGPLLLGGRGSLPAFGGRGARRLATALRLRPLPVEERFPGLDPRHFELFRP
jgi:diaminohydroxyphosphoribosylaminopyrimidine deaminase/5-amino-6-(5-phosphoribosylamino)uracil reductase